MSTFRLLSNIVRSCVFSTGQHQFCPKPVVGFLVARNDLSNNRNYTSCQKCTLSDTSSKNDPSTTQLYNWVLHNLQGKYGLSIYNRCYFSTKMSFDRAGKSDSKASAAIADGELFGETSKLGVFAKFKLMYKKYWYVLIPVHVVTSVGWFGGFYYLSKSGVDISEVLQFLHLSESLIEKVQSSEMGHIAIAYLCYKIATPVRYALTLGGTTLSIKYLVQMGHIKPIPSKDEIVRMYEEKKACRAAAKAGKTRHDKPK